MKLGDLATEISKELIDPRTRYGMAWRLVVWPLTFPMLVLSSVLRGIAHLIAYGDLPEDYQ